MPLNEKAQAVFNSIRRSFAGDRLAHAYLAVGEPRLEGAAFAEALLALLACSAQGQRPCGRCAGCRHARERSHPDMLWVEPQKKSRTIQREQVLQVQQHVFRTAFEGGWKAVVLVNADRLNDVAANTLLKTLEEPPPRSLFLLLSNIPELLLPTVVSRCQRVIISGAGHERDPDLQAAFLAIIGAERDDRVIAALGRARRLLQLLQQLRKKIEAQTIEELGLGGQDAELDKELKVILAARVEARYREARHGILRWLLLWYRDLLLCAHGVEPAAFYFKEASAQIGAAASGLTPRGALANMRVVEEIGRQLDQSLLESLVFENGFIRLAAGTRAARAASGPGRG
jgi:DNA polymerase III subunit delta'